MIPIGGHSSCRNGCHIERLAGARPPPVTRPQAEPACGNRHKCNRRGKLANIRTSEDRRKTIEIIRRDMSVNLTAALRARAAMESAAVAEAAELIGAFQTIKQKIENRANALGYPERCRQSIPVCGGECCRWHFPKALTAVDFFIAVFDLQADEHRALIEQVRPAAKTVFQCPLLRKNGCFFTFQNRPAVCTSAFPCLAGNEYWQYKERFRKELETLHSALQAMMKNGTAGKITGRELGKGRSDLSVAPFITQPSL